LLALFQAFLAVFGGFLAVEYYRIFDDFSLAVKNKGLILAAK
jgi:hypothetical protein